MVADGGGWPRASEQANERSSKKARKNARITSHAFRETLAGIGLANGLVERGANRRAR